MILAFIMHNFNKDKELVMMKKVAMLLMGIGLGSSLYATEISESKVFIGLEVGYAEVQGSVGSMAGDEVIIEPNFTGDNDVEFGARIGAQNGQWRTTFLFDYYDSTDNDQNYEKGLFTIDYYLFENDSAFKPYIGFNVGYANYESDYVDDSGFLYGGQAGVVIEVADMINVDLGYRYSLSDADALDHIGSVVFGVNYIF